MCAKWKPYCLQLSVLIIIRMVTTSSANCNLSCWWLYISRWYDHFPFFLSSLNPNLSQLLLMLFLVKYAITRFSLLCILPCNSFIVHQSYWLGFHVIHDHQMYLNLSCSWHEVVALLVAQLLLMQNCLQISWCSWNVLQDFRLSHFFHFVFSVEITFQGF